MEGVVVMQRICYTSTSVAHLCVDDELSLPLGVSVGVLVHSSGAEALLRPCVLLDRLACDTRQQRIIITASQNTAQYILVVPSATCFK